MTSHGIQQLVESPHTESLDYDLGTDLTLRIGFQVLCCRVQPCHLPISMSRIAFTFNSPGRIQSWIHVSICFVSNFTIGDLSMCKFGQVFPSMIAERPALQNYTMG